MKKTIETRDEKMTTQMWRFTAERKCGIRLMNELDLSAATPSELPSGDAPPLRSQAQRLLTDGCFQWLQPARRSDPLSCFGFSCSGAGPSPIILQRSTIVGPGRDHVWWRVSGEWRATWSRRLRLRCHIHSKWDQTVVEWIEAGRSSTADGPSFAPICVILSTHRSSLLYNQGLCINVETLDRCSNSLLV